MRKVILSLAISLDGFIEGPNGEYDWCFTDQDYGMAEFLKRIDTIFYGRKSYELMKADGGGENLWRDKKQYVFSNSLKQKSNEFEIISGNIEQRVKEIKNLKGKDIWLFGGAILANNLLNFSLVDELGLAVHPILLGKGKLLFSGSNARIKTELIHSKTYNTGLVYLSYSVINQSYEKVKR
jgi:dihydrofolate reductase